VGQIGSVLSQEVQRPKPQEEKAMIKQLAIKPVITASARMTIAEAARAMKQKNVGALIVVNAGRPLGVLTDRDIAMDVVAAGKDPDAVRVEDVMRKKPATLREDLGLMDAARIFAKTGVRRLPVVDKAGRVSGIVALDDLMMLLGNEMGLVAGALAAGLRKAS
jgi:CBS domain-containing protein